MELYSLAQCSIYNDQPAEKQTNMTTIMAWHPYRLLELYNTTHGGIYIHIHSTYTKNITSKYIPKKFTQLVNREWYIAHIWSVISHVASSGPKCFHYTLTCSIARFQSTRIFLCNIYWGFGWNSPSSSSCNTNQSITWSTSLTYFLSNYTWKTSWTFIVEGSASR